MLRYDERVYTAQHATAGRVGRWGPTGEPEVTPSMVRSIYQSVVPRPVRGRLWQARRQVPRRLHELRWKVASEAYLRRWTEDRLDPGRYCWLFILGCNNSGTTLLSEILGAHPLVRTMPKEGQWMTAAIPNSTKLGVGRVFSQRLDAFRWTEAEDGACVQRLRYDWARHFRPGPGVLLEKSPPNTLRSRWLQRFFRPARFIAIVRDPYAIVEGISRRRGHSITEAAQHWRQVHEVLREDLPYLEHCLLIHYESLCESPQEHLGRIERFLDLPVPFPDSLLERQFRAHNIEGRPMALENMNPRSWARLSASDIETITRVVGDELRHFGYQPLQTESSDERGHLRPALA